MALRLPIHTDHHRHHDCIGGHSSSRLFNFGEGATGYPHSKSRVSHLHWYCGCRHHRILIGMKRDLKPYGATRKLVCFKLLVAVIILQTVVFSALAKSKVYRNTPHSSFEDWTYGVPNIFTSCESVLFSIMFAWAFSAGPYRRVEPLSSYTDTTPVAPTKKLGFGYAILDVINIVDVLRGVWIAMKVLVRLPFGYKGLLKADGSPAADEKRIPSKSSVESSGVPPLNAAAVA
jgi:hypothetical protein